MAVMDGSTMPFEYRREIVIRGGGQTTLAAGLAALEAEILDKLPYPCAICSDPSVQPAISTGLVNNGTAICPNCKGWGATEVQQIPTAPVALTPEAPTPTETLS